MGGVSATKSEALLKLLRGLVAQGLLGYGPYRHGVKITRHIAMVGGHLQLQAG